MGSRHWGDRNMLWEALFVGAIAFATLFLLMAM